MKKEGNNLVEEIYERISALNWKVYILCVGILFGFIAIFSLFLGNPFPYKESVLITTIWVDGWILERPFLFLLICIIVYILLTGWELKEIYSNFKPLKDIIFQECNPMKLLEITQKAVLYPVKKRFERLVALPQFEQLHIE